MGHCTLKDCDVAGTAATSKASDRYTIAFAFLIDIRSPPSRVSGRAFCGEALFRELANNAVPRGYACLSKRKDRIYNSTNLFA